MAISQTIDVIESALWPQGDIRDPLGTWGFRSLFTGDASGGSMKLFAQVPLLKTAAYLYTCYSLNIAQLTGAINIVNVKARLLTNWPDIDPLAGIQGYSSLRTMDLVGGNVHTAPIAGPFEFPLVSTLERFILLFDPRSRTNAMTIVELELNLNTNPSTWSFEGYGYFWDRSVLNAPGGPRHPGAS